MFKTLIAFGWAVLFCSQSFAQVSILPFEEEYRRSDGVTILQDNIVNTRELFYANTEPGLFSHKMPLTVVWLMSSQWSAAEIMHRLEYVAKALQTCGVMIPEVRFVTAVTTRDLLYIAPSEIPHHPGRNDYDLAAATAHLQRPVMYYVESVESVPGVAFARVAADWPTPLANTAFLGYQGIYRSRSAYRNACAGNSDCWLTIDAHELTHILTNNSRHVDSEPNTLGNIAMGRMATRLTASQCMQVWNHPLVRTLDVGAL